MTWVSTKGAIHKRKPYKTWVSTKGRMVLVRLLRLRSIESVCNSGIREHQLLDWRVQLSLVTGSVVLAPPCLNLRIQFSKSDT
jgi:hypothetical protein